MRFFCWLVLLKGTLPQNISNIKSAHIDTYKYLRYRWFEIKKIKERIDRYGNFSYLLVPETLSLLHVRSKVALLHVRSKVCITPFQVWSKFIVFALHIEGCDADFALHMKGSHADFAPHMQQRHGLWDQI